ncbi:hypothetical protein V3C99_008288 [Haemonchus contortus]
MMPSSVAVLAHQAHPLVSLLSVSCIKVQFATHSVFLILLRFALRAIFTEVTLPSFDSSSWIFASGGIAYRLSS